MIPGDMAFYQRYSTYRCEGCICHHGNRRWRQIQIGIQVCNAERPLTCGAAANVQTFTYGRCYDITRSRVNNGIKDLPTHQFVLALLCLWLLLYLRHSLNGNINFKIRLLLECAIHAIWQLGPEVFKDLFCVLKSISCFVTHGLINFTLLNDTFIFLGANTTNSVKNNHCEWAISAIS